MMLRHARTLLWASVAAGCASFGSAAYASSTRMEPHSFLQSRVNSVQQLVKQVRTNPKVALRYQKQFGMPASKIAAYFESNLRIQKTAVSGKYLVYYYKENGKIYSNQLRMKSGTPLFVSKTNGAPILKVSCGNPMRKKLPPPPQVSRPKVDIPPPPKPKISLNPEPPEPIVPPEPPEPIVPPPMDEPEIAPTVTLEPQPIVPEAEPVPISQEPTPEIISQGDITIPPVAGFNPAGLLLLAPLAFINTGGGGGGEPIPEPMTIVTVAMGTAFAIKAARRKRQ